MAEMKGGDDRRTQLVENLRNKRRYLELKEEAEGPKSGNDSLSYEHQDEILVIIHKYIILLKKQQ